LDVLRAEQLSLKEEMAMNDELGYLVRATVDTRAKPNEFVKFNLHVAEIDKITSLLLGLSGRLARTENEIQGMPPNAQVDRVSHNELDLHYF
jgi:protein Shroom